MDFHTMGRTDAMVDVDKSGIEGESKTATIRLSSDYLDLLNSIAKIVGVSRQAFMSSLIEQYAETAIADYYSGYSEVFGVGFSDILPDDVPEKNKENFDKFIENVQFQLAFNKVLSKGFKCLPSDDEDKMAYFELAKKNSSFFRIGS